MVFYKLLLDMNLFERAIVALSHSANGQPLNFWGLYIYIIGKIKFKLLFHDPLAIVALLH